MTVFYTEKGWWKSKTVWVGLIATAYAALSFLGIPIPLGIDQATAGEFVTGVLGLLAIYFRVTATEAISTDVIPTSE